VSQLIDEDVSLEVELDAELAQYALCTEMLLAAETNSIRSEELAFKWDGSALPVKCSEPCMS
jgi:hypothetical protein